MHCKMSAANGTSSRLSDGRLFTNAKLLGILPCFWLHTSTEDRVLWEVCVQLSGASEHVMLRDSREAVLQERAADPNRKTPS